MNVRKIGGHGYIQGEDCHGEHSGTEVEPENSMH
jgi:hypothetical protein